MRKNFCCSLLMKPSEAVVLPGREVDVVFLQLAAESAAGDAKLLGGERALASGTLQGLDDHLLFHAVQIADGHGGGLAERGRLSGQRGAEAGEIDFRAWKFHRHLCH